MFLYPGFKDILFDQSFTIVNFIFYLYGLTHIKNNRILTLCIFKYSGEKSAFGRQYCIILYGDRVAFENASILYRYVEKMSTACACSKKVLRLEKNLKNRSDFKAKTC